MSKINVVEIRMINGHRFILSDRGDPSIPGPDYFRGLHVWRYNLRHHLSASA
jgi:hypothetical protein